MKFVVTFNRDRDFYQVPLALAEARVLDRLITDLYIPDYMRDWRIVHRLGIAHRRIEGLPSELVQSSPDLILGQAIGLRLARSEAQRISIFKWLDKKLSRRSLRRAILRNVGMLSYSGYALECFSDPVMQERVKHLFVFHPHADLPREILSKDLSLHPEVGASNAVHMAEMESSDKWRVEAEIKLASSILCASSFTKKSVEVVCPPNTPISVVPYGCETPGLVMKMPLKNRPVNLLYIGQGVQRKGLHHLLKVWQKHGRGWNARLTVIAGRVDPGIAKLAEDAGVVILPNQTRSKIAEYFALADVFVMPSLVEGFGLVYLEAFAAGCYVIGTKNTGLPDLNPPMGIASVLEAGDLNGLAETLNSLIVTHRDSLDYQHIQGFAAQNTWSNFRAGIRSAVGV
jgi:glycosyltransferase involved in cell wall biosynthesis